jgi:hypothetical protein
MGFLAEANFPDSALYEFDIDSLTSSFVGYLPCGMDGLDFNGSDELLAINNVTAAGDTYKLHEINVTSALAILKGDTNVVREGFHLAGLTFDNDGTLFAVMDDILFKISPIDGSVISEIGPTGFSGVSGLTAFQAVPVLEPVAVDIKPGNCPNPFTLPRDVVDVRGKLPVAILGSEDFDVRTIDPMTIRMTREGVDREVAPLRWDYEDVATPFDGELCDCHDLNWDGYLDLTLKFNRRTLANVLNLYEPAGETISLAIIGSLYEEYDETPFRGEDCVRIKVKKNKKNKRNNGKKK